MKTFEAMAPFPGFKPRAIGAVCMGRALISEQWVPAIFLLQTTGSYDALHAFRIDDGQRIESMDLYDLYPFEGCFNVPPEWLPTDEEKAGVAEGGAIGQAYGQVLIADS